MAVSTEMINALVERVQKTQHGFTDIRRAASRGCAIQLLSQLRTDESEYVRKSVGNALRDISRQHADLIRAELGGWDVADKRVAYVHKLTNKFV